MTVATLLSGDSWVSAGTLAPRSIPFPFINLDDLRATYTPVLGAVQNLVRGTHYTITGDNRAGTAVFTPLVTFPAGGSFRVFRATRPLQEYETERSTPLDAESVERELDRQAMRNLEQDAAAAELTTRAIKAMMGQTAPEIDITGLDENDLLIFKDGKLRRQAREAFAGKFYAGGPGGVLTPSSGLGGGDLSLRGDLAAALGTQLIGFQQPGTGAKVRNILDRTRMSSILASDFDTLPQALAAMVLLGKKKIEIDTAVSITADVTFPSGIVVECTQGSFVVTSGATITDAMFKVVDGGDVLFINPRIDASAKAGGCPALKVVNSSRVEMWGGKLTRCNLLLESSDNTVSRQIVVYGTTIDMDGRASTAIYCSGVNGVLIDGVEMYGGREGVGIYNNALNIIQNNCKSHDFTQDAFVIIAGQQILYAGCSAWDTGQSGFTTQRQTSGANSRIATWIGCFSWGHSYDGYDIRGANTEPWGVDTVFLLVGCHGWDNGRDGLGGVGFYIVNAEGTKLIGCTGRQNKFQNLHIDKSADVLVVGFTSISGAVDITEGVGNAGIYVANSINVQVNGSRSTNAEGGTQAYGIVFAGVCTNCSVTGGNYLGNSVASHSLAAGVAMVGAQFDKEAAGAVTVLEISVNGIKRGECFGVPSVSFDLNWVKGSELTRADGGGAEKYIQATANDWYLFDRTAV